MLQVRQRCHGGYRFHRMSRPYETPHPESHRGEKINNQKNCDKKDDQQEHCQTFDQNEDDQVAN